MSPRSREGWAHYRRVERLWRTEMARSAQRAWDWSAVDHRLRLARECADRDLDSVLMGACLELQGNRWEMEKYLGEALAAWGGALAAYQRDEVPEHALSNCDRVKQLIRNWFDIPRVFVSYARKDVRRVQTIVRHLQQIGADVLWDQDLFVPGVDLSALVGWSMGDLTADAESEIEHAVTTTLRVAGIYLVAWSRTYAMRPWTTYELTCAFDYLNRLRATGCVGPRVVIARLDTHPLPETDEVGLWVDLSRGLRPRARDELARAVRSTELLRPRSLGTPPRGARRRRPASPAGRSGSG